MGLVPFHWFMSESVFNTANDLAGVAVLDSLAGEFIAWLLQLQYHGGSTYSWIFFSTKGVSLGRRRQVGIALPN